MKLFNLAALIVLASATTAVHLHHHQRRDVSELAAEPAYSYLPPAQRISLPEPETTTPEIVTEAAVDAASTRLGQDGYEYRTVRRLKYRYRTQRDVSHLAQNYLPPRAEYLPPVEPAAPIVEEDTVEILAAAPRDLASEYLPPAHVEEEAAPTEAPAVKEAEVTAAEEEEVEEEQTEAPQAEEVLPEVSARLADDGYHYKQPIEEPAELRAVETTTNVYLPPLEKNAVEAEGPEESAVLADDGYHYRAIRRLKF